MAGLVRPRTGPSEGGDATHHAASIGRMSQRSAIRSEGDRPIPTWFVLGLIGFAASLAYIVLWRGVTRLGSFFGDDLYAYTQAADRLAATGSPYHPALLAGPIVS